MLGEVETDGVSEGDILLVMGSMRAIPKIFGISVEMPISVKLGDAKLPYPLFLNTKAPSSNVARIISSRPSSSRSTILN